MLFSSPRETARRDTQPKVSVSPANRVPGNREIVEGTAGEANRSTSLKEEELQTSGVQRSEPPRLVRGLFRLVLEASLSCFSYSAISSSL